jgi:hypothetical protein
MKWNDALHSLDGLKIPMALYRLVGDFPRKCDKCCRYLRTHHWRCKKCREA